MTASPKAVKTDKTGHSEDFSLTEKQNLAVMELVKGATDEEAAKIAGVSRSTVNDWRNTHPAFRAAVVNKRAEIWKETKRPLREALIAALETVNKSIKDGDSKTAQWLLDKVGIDEIAKAILDNMKENPTTPAAQVRCIAREKEWEMERLAENVAERRVKDLGIEFYDDPFGEKKKQFKMQALAILKEEEEKKALNKVT
jgi:hypothetical protein